MSEWISVKDRLPSEQGVYLVIDKNYTERNFGQYIEIAAYSNHIWHSNAFCKVDITHWMPLPPAPEKDK